MAGTQHPGDGRDDEYTFDETPTWLDGTKTPRKMQLAAKYIKDKGVEEDRYLPDVDEALRNTRPIHTLHYMNLVKVAQGNKYQYAHWLGKRIGDGSKGKVFLARMSDRIAELRENALFRLGRRMPNMGSEVCIKLVFARRHDDGMRVDRDVISAVREASWQRYLSSDPESSCFRVPACRFGLCPERFVPKLWWHGMVFDQVTRKRVFVFIMGKAEGAPVASIKRPLAATEYVRIERALCALWWAGVAHADAHLKNIFVGDDKSVTLIDFGFATKLSTAIRDAIRARIPQAIARGVGSLGEIWRADSEVGTGAEGFVNRVQHTRITRGRPSAPNTAGRWYNPDGHMLMRLYSRMSKEERARVPSERRRAWGHAGDGPQNVTTNSNNPRNSPRNFREPAERTERKRALMDQLVALRSQKAEVLREMLKRRKIRTPGQEASPYSHVDSHGP